MSWLEQLRVCHEDIELCERDVSQELSNRSKSQKEQILQDHRIKKKLDTMQASSRRLLELHNDADGIGAEERRVMSGDGQNCMTVFFNKLTALKKYHHDFPNSETNFWKQMQELHEARQRETLHPVLKEKADSEIAQAHRAREETLVQFSGDEVFGRCLDLHAQFDMFIDMPQFRNKGYDYHTYLEVFLRFNLVTPESRNKQYKQYLKSLYEYLLGFFKRIQPLTDADAIIANVDQDFNSRWKAGQPTSGKSAGGAAPMDVVDTSNPLYCQTCRKMFAKPTVFQAHLRGRPHLRAVKEGLLFESMAGAVDIFESRSGLQRALALLEARILKLGEILEPQRLATKRNLDKKQSMNEREFRDDVEHEELAPPEPEVDSDEDEEEKPIYNPLNLPLGWDGKPIPYWLYKLHGLGNEYKCEICGNYSYWGRRAFERHFTEWRHAHGMRCLKIPNTKHFAEITQIEDALQLWEKIRVSSAEIVWRPDTEEECEDADGNVYDKKTFDYLRRQRIVV
eukprot:gnl/Spiro4/20772_TR10113_c0_g1_i1.p1 gnl/Spiro4/20772_TR10113_c0_g1~~gnl/Spiro4/20772_TR10113_c0_g1_i1.p1  ORF type:complete len:529 (+),score=143.96 gnl/Spiro4/20772_TR10113_c0_g1_i1:58-1587(+)